MKLSRLLLAVFAILLTTAPLFGGNKDEGPVSAVSFVVLKDDNGKPIRNAAVILHPVGPHGKQGKTGFELKADDQGKTHFDGIPYGTWRIQVIAPGFQTFGDDFHISQTEQQITIRMKRPQGQYSIYDKHDGSGGGSNNSPPPDGKQQ